MPKLVQSGLEIGKRSDGMNLCHFHSFSISICQFYANMQMWPNSAYFGCIFRLVAVRVFKKYCHKTGSPACLCRIVILDCRSFCYVLSVAIFNVLLGYFAGCRVRLFLDNVSGYFWGIFCWLFLGISGSTECLTVIMCR